MATTTRISSDVPSERLSGKNSRVALNVMCLGMLMTVVDGTIVTIALPSIKRALNFSDTSVVWIVNAYLLCYAGFRLLGGRLSDLFSARKLFLLATAFFTFASLACASANLPALLIVARGLQGVGGALITSTALSLIIRAFTEESRAKAISYFGMAASSGGVVGLVIGGFLTQVFNWRALFLINLPIGIAVYLFGFRHLPQLAIDSKVDRVDVGGAALLIALPMILVYMVLQGNETGWYSSRTLILLLCSISATVLFVRTESRAHAPIIPLGIFRRRSLGACIIATMLLSIACSAVIFTSLYLQLVLKRSPLDASFTLIPSTLLVTPLSLGLSSKVVSYFGTKCSLMAGLTLTTFGLMLLTQTSVSGTAIENVLPGTLFISLGTGIAYMPLTLATVSCATTADSGLISAISGTSSILGNALGLSILATLASTRENTLLISGVDLQAALNGGYHVAFFAASIFAALGLIVTGVFIREPNSG